MSSHAAPKPVHVFVCRGCGKRSYAKRDPIAHERAVTTTSEDGQTKRRDYLWCGPFDRYVATLDTSRPQRDASKMEHLGTPSRPPDEWFPDDSDIPF
jgi:hypothetical protein